ncbi:MAG: basic secretory family protein [Pirellulales bacterium]|nr:basic secretory family protein [Pirellulales bacterium]
MASMGLLAVMAVGCASLWPGRDWSGASWNSAANTPGKFAIKRDQLRIYSDAELPEDHRLFDDLMSLRDDVLSELQLPSSEEAIHVYLFDSSNRFADFIDVNYPSFPKRRAFFVETDRQLSVYAHWGDRVAEDLQHEVTHGYLHSVVPRIPLWLDEGLAEYFETPRGEAGLNAPHVEDLGWKFRGGWRPNLFRLEALNSAADMTQLDYAESWAWAHLMLRSKPATRQVLHQYLADLREQGTTEPLSFRLRAMMPAPEAALVRHLEALFEAARMARSGNSTKVH